MNNPLVSAGRCASPGPSEEFREGRMTARVSRSTSSNEPGAVTGPASVTNSVSISSRARCTPMDAAALTAYSKDEAGPRPPWPESRVSRKSTARFRQRCSSRRTMSSPYRAVERQCTRRSSSPSR